MKHTTGCCAAINHLLNELLGVAARKPGKAAELPAVIRVIESLEPAGGTNFPIFPASYAGASDNDPPVYDLSGIEYGDVDETIRGKGKTTVQRRHILERNVVQSTRRNHKPTARRLHSMKTPIFDH